MNKEYQRLSQMKVDVTITVNGHSHKERVPQKLVRHYARMEYEMVRNALICANVSFLMCIAEELLHDSIPWFPAIVGVICLYAGVYSWRYPEKMIIQAINSDTSREVKKQLGI